MAWNDIQRTALFETHEVTNQAPPLVELNLFGTDRALREAVIRGDARWAVPSLDAFGTLLGRADTMELGRLANACPPVLHSVDRTGRRIDEVEFHPAYHQLLGLAVGEGLHTGPWADARPGAHVARAAGVHLMCQVEAGVQCPTTMTYGSVPALAAQPAIARDWMPLLYSRHYDRRALPATLKTGAMIGMGMTEKQGGSDLRTNTSRATALAERVEAPGQGVAYAITGHKWFLSAPMCDAFLVLAQAPEGPSCFFMPRFLPDGSRNALHLQRLKDKLGNRSNASSEVEFHGAIAWLVGEPGRGVPTILEMGSYTRLDCALGSAGLMRQALAQALHHAAHRTAFQKRLIDQPLMGNLLADLAIESEAATTLVLRLAEAYDRQQDPAEAALRRILTPAVKYWICRRAPGFVGEAMEVLGGNGYVEESLLPRLYREAPVNSIWEGSGNVMCLDVLRAATRSPDTVTALHDELAKARGGDARFDLHVSRLQEQLRAGSSEAEARRLAESIAVAVTAGLLLRFAPSAMAGGFCASRLSGERYGAYGTLPKGLDEQAIIERARPV